MKEKSLTLASVVAAAGASLCCIGPLVAAGLGLGAFGAAGLFENLRPYLLAATALLLGSAIFLRIRSQQKTHCVEGVCPPAAARKSTSGILFWVAIAAAAGLAAIPQISNAFLGGQTGLIALASQRTQGDSVASFAIQGMTCAGCAAGIKATLGRENGVLAAEVSYEKAMAQVRFDPAKTSVEKLLTVLAGLGYAAEWKGEKP